MIDPFVNIALSAGFISFILWISRINPILGGFLLSLPLTTLVALGLGRGRHLLSEQEAIQMAQSVFFAIPLSLLFFVPFLIADRLKLSFWQAYASGLVLLGLAYLIHTLVAHHFFK